MGVFKKKGIWYIDYYFEGRRLREAIGSNKNEAAGALAVRKAEIVQGRYHFKNKAEHLLLSELADKYLEYSKANKKSYRRDKFLVKNLLSFFKKKKLYEITCFSIEQYKIARKEEVSPSTVNREISCLRHMLNLAIKWGLIEKNPMRDVKLFKEPEGSMRILSVEEEKRLLFYSAEHLKPIIITALNTGMRLGEILALTWLTVDFTNDIISVEQSKSGESRKIPVNSYLKETLKDIKLNSIVKGVKEEDKVFFWKNGKPLTKFRTAFLGALKRSGIEYLRFHDLRHTFATRLVLAGVDLVTVKELLGHKSVRMTMRYSHPTAEHKRKAVQVLENGKYGHPMDTQPEKEKQQFTQPVENK